MISAEIKTIEQWEIDTGRRIAALAQRVSVRNTPLPRAHVVPPHALEPNPQTLMTGAVRDR
ncbi:MAG TPA: hypothetical protein VJN70_00895 [Gemmatimonadaceae bacterium]|nr:hypothetical protein [Gemmatimonadaceae bacterium]